MKFQKKFHKDLDTIYTHSRKQYRVPNMRKIVARIDRNCKFCLILRQKVTHHVMGNLLGFRSKQSGAFENCNFDPFCPITIKDNILRYGPYSRKKIFGFVFVCCASRAIYLDIAEDYSTKSILHSIWRLLAEKRSISKLILDPGAQLKGENRKLHKVRQGWSEAELIRLGAG